MIFTTPSFFIFFAIFITLWWWLLPKENIVARKVFLIIASYVFYAFAGIQWLITLFLTSLLTYCASKLISKSNKYKKLIACFAITALIGQLIFWKYIPWAVITWNEMAFMNNAFYIEPPEFLFPAGLSFFTFHALSLLIPVWLEKKEPYSLLDTLAHISFFPALLAGPVLRFNDVNYRWKEKWSWENVEWENGVFRILIGATFKWVLASKCAEYADLAFNGFAENSSQVLIGVHAYALQIFFDFAGYSHMAIGFALLMGWRLPENFTYPYMSTSIQEFWRNWHRSLSFFFRDNFYIHLLGGNKKGKNKALFNAFLTMLVSGLWHGANMTFILWGAYHGTLLVLQNILGRFLNIKIPKLISWLITFELVVIGWVLFKSEDISSAITVYQQYFDINGLSSILNDFSVYGFIWTISMVCIILFEKKIMQLFDSLTIRLNNGNTAVSLFENTATVLFVCAWTYLIIKLGPIGVPNFIYNGF